MTPNPKTRNGCQGMLIAPLKNACCELFPEFFLLMPSIISWLKLSLLVVSVYLSLLSCQLPLILSTETMSPFNLGSNYRPTFREQCITVKNVNDLKGINESRTVKER